MPKRAMMTGLGPILTTAAMTAGVMAAVPAVAPPTASAAVSSSVALTATDGFGLVMGGTGNPTPDSSYFDAMVDKYLSELFPGTGTSTDFWHALPTPEQFCPFVCLPPGPPPPFPLPPPLDPNDYPPNLTFGSSVSTGAGILNQAIRDQGVPALAAGNDVYVSGYSQSGTVASVSFADLLANAKAGTAGWPSEADLTHLHYELTGDPNSPAGGILNRFQFPDSITGEMQHVPFVNIPLGTAPTPTDGIGESYIITGMYDGWSNFPQDVLNIPAVINALAGIATVHPFYTAYSPEQIASAVDVGTIGNTHFLYIPENLPLLQFMYNGGTAGQFFGDAFNPILRWLINLGYGNASDPAVNGLYQISGAAPEAGSGGFINGSPFEQAIGVAGGPWAATPTGALYGSADSVLAAGLTTDDMGVAGLFQKLDPLQVLAGFQWAVAASLVGPWVNVIYDSGDAVDVDAVNGVMDTILTLDGYYLVNAIDKAIIDGWSALVADSPELASIIGPDAVFDGPLIPGDPILGLVGLGFDIFNVFGA